MANSRRRVSARSSVESLPVLVDQGNAQAVVGTQRLHLTPRSFAVLVCLVDRAGQLVTKSQLHRLVWRGAEVSDGALVVCVRELRKALGDDARVPRYIETVHRRGYRYVGPALAEASSADVIECAAVMPEVIGRDAELARLHACYQTACTGKAQMVFVAGEPGIGKTTLINAFLAVLQAGPSVAATVADDRSGHTPVRTTRLSVPALAHRTAKPRIARGQCIELYGATEAYLPILEALDRVCRNRDGVCVIDVLEREAPGWLAHLTGLTAGARFDALLRRSHGTTQARMLRELAVALEQLSAERPFVLVLEDLHWSDRSTIDALSMLARRRERARLLVICTYRPSDMRSGNLPLCALRDELLALTHCQEIAPANWGNAEIRQYLARWSMAGTAVPCAVAANAVELLHERTGGNPLFVTAMIDEFETRGVLTRDALGWHINATLNPIHTIPLSIRQLLTRQGKRLPAAARALLEAASVAGFEFSAAAAAAALELQTFDVERHCDALAAQGQFLRRAGIAIWPDGTLAARYAFVHALHQEIWYEQLTPTVLQTYHRRIGLRKEAGFGARASEIAGELAAHFIDGRDLPRAIDYLCLAGASAAQRSAHNEAVRLLTAGLDLVKGLPRDDALDRRELHIQNTLGPVLMAARGYGAPEVEQTYAQARKLSFRVGEKSQTFKALYGQWTYSVVRPRHRVALGIAHRLLVLSRQLDGPHWRIEAHWALGCSHFLLGEIRLGNHEFALAAKRYRAAQAHALAYEFGHDPAVSTLSFGAVSSWMLGRLDQAVSDAQEALRIAEQLGHPFSHVYALTFGAWIRLLEGEYTESARLAQAGLEHSQIYGVPQFRAMCSIFLGAAQIFLGAGTPDVLATISDHIADYQRGGAESICPHFLTLYAQACATMGMPAAGLIAIDEGLAMLERNEERWCEAELYRVRAMLTLSLHGPAAHTAVEADLRRAIDIANRQLAITPALRACTAYARLLQTQGQEPAAARILRDALAVFHEGFDCADLQAGAAMLAELTQLRPLDARFGPSPA